MACMVELSYRSHRKIVPSYYNSAIIASWVNGTILSSAKNSVKSWTIIPIQAISIMMQLSCLIKVRFNAIMDTKKMRNHGY